MATDTLHEVAAESLLGRHNLNNPPENGDFETDPTYSCGNQYTFRDFEHNTYDISNSGGVHKLYIH